MNIKKINQDLISYWNQQFEKVEVKPIAMDDIVISDELDEMLEMIGNHCPNVIDFGCGCSLLMLKAAVFGNQVEKGLGIDPSHHAICFSNESIKQVGFNYLNYICGDHLYLKQIDDQSIDGVICSNVLDVLPYETSKFIIHEFRRIIKTKGYLLVKINFFLTDELIQRIGMEKISQNTYSINGILRGYNLSTDDWIQRFDGFEVEKIGSYQRLKDGPKDRLLLLRRV